MAAQEANTREALESLRRENQTRVSDLKHYHYAYVQQSHEP